MTQITAVNSYYILLYFCRFSAVEHTITSDEPEGHANYAVNDISEHNSKTK